MYYPALGVQVVEALEHLLDDDAHVLQRYSAVPRPDDELQQVAAEDLEHHAHVRAVDAVDLEVVEQHDGPFSELVVRVAVTNLGGSKVVMIHNIRL